MNLLSSLQLWLKVSPKARDDWYTHSEIIKSVHVYKSFKITEDKLEVEVSMHNATTNIKKDHNEKGIFYALSCCLK